MFFLWAERKRRLVSTSHLELFKSTVYTIVLGEGGVSVQGTGKLAGSPQADHQGD